MYFCKWKHKLHVSRLSLLCTLPYIGYKDAESFKLDLEVILLLNILINVDTQVTKAIFIDLTFKIFIMKSNIN